MLVNEMHFALKVAWGVEGRWMARGCLGTCTAAVRRVVHSNFRDCWSLVRRSSREARSCGGAEALKKVVKDVAANAYGISADDKVCDLLCDDVALPAVPECVPVLNGPPEDARGYYSKEENVVGPLPFLTERETAAASCGGPRKSTRSLRCG